MTHLPTTVLLLGRAPRGRGRKHKTTPLPPRLADVAPAPPKAPTRKKGEEGTERMVQALTELLRRARAPQPPRSRARAREPSTPRRSRGRPPGRPAGPCRKKQQAVVVAEAAVTIPKSEPPPPVVPVQHKAGSWKCKEGPGPGPGTPKRGGQPGRGGRGGRGRGRGGLPLMIKFVSKAKKVKMGQLSQGLESGQGRGQRGESWQDAPQRRDGDEQERGPCRKKQEQKLEEEGEEKGEKEDDSEDNSKQQEEEDTERAVAEEEVMLAKEKEEAKLPSPPLTPPVPSPPPPLPPPSTSPPPASPLPPPVSPPPPPSPPPYPAPEKQEESPPLVPATCSRKRGRPPLTPSQRAEREAARSGPEGTLSPTANPSSTTGSPVEDSPTVVPKSTTFLKNIRQFIMPVVSARSSRVIKTPRRFMDEDPPKPPKVEASIVRPPVATSPLAPQEPVPVSSPPRVPTPPSTPVPLPEKRRSILREPTFRWTSLTRELPPPPPAPPPAPSPPPAPATPSRRPLLLRAPQFTPSEAHLKIYESVLTPPPLGALEAPEPELPPADDSPAEPEPRAVGRTNHLSLPRFVPVVTTPVKVEMPPHGAPALSEGQQLQLQQPPQALQTQLLPQALPPQQPQMQPPPSPQHTPPLEKTRVASLGPLPLSGVEEKMFSLLKRAKVQLFKIDQQQQQKVAASMPVSVVL